MKSISRSDYERIFAQERSQQYPAITAFEHEMGYWIDDARLESAAFTLACPLKANPPNWQHGRVLYAAFRKYLEGRSEYVKVLDCGTAKGFSALCMAFALADSAASALINSVDVIDPNAEIARNSVLECERLRNVYEFVAPWPESQLIRFHQSTGVNWLRANPERIHFAFIDGKHSYEAVSEEAKLLTDRQQTGDISIFDDLQIAGVKKAVLSATGGYRVRVVNASPTRQYAIATRA